MRIKAKLDKHRDKFMKIRTELCVTKGCNKCKMKGKSEEISFCCGDRYVHSINAMTRRKENE